MILTRDQSEDLREKLAELEHRQWIEWSKSLVSLEMLSPSRVERWKGLWRPYDRLTESEKDSDRVWADEALTLVLIALKSK